MHEGGRRKTRLRAKATDEHVEKERCNGEHDAEAKETTGALATGRHGCAVVCELERLPVEVHATVLASSRVHRYVATAVSTRDERVFLGAPELRGLKIDGFRHRSCVLPLKQPNVRRQRRAKRVRCTPGLGR